MVGSPTRRQFLATGVGGLAALAGCQSILGAEVSIVVRVLNATRRSQDAYLELTRPDDETFQIGRVLPIEAGVVETVDLTVPTGTYRMLFNIDDAIPRPEETVDWEISDDDCVPNKYWVITQSGSEGETQEGEQTGIDIQLVDENCDSE